MKIHTMVIVRLFWQKNQLEGWNIISGTFLDFRRHPPLRVPTKIIHFNFFLWICFQISIMINLEPFSKLIINCQSKIRLKLDVSEVKPSYYLFVHRYIHIVMHSGIKMVYIVRQYISIKNVKYQLFWIFSQHLF